MSDLETRLREEQRQTAEQLERLEDEYATLLEDPDAIQEDRDTTRQVLEEARAAAELATRALDRFEQGTYGACVRCGNAIGDERLEALPGVETCISCHGEPL